MGHDTQRPIFLDGVDNTGSLLFRHELLHDGLPAETIWLHNFNRGDGLIRPKMNYELRDNLVVWLGLDVFYGTRTGLFGEFDQNDRVVIGIESGL